MIIRQSQERDLEEIMGVYAHAREFMKQHDNPDQWGSVWPPEELIRKDIDAGKSYVAVVDEKDDTEAEAGSIAAVFFYDYGEHADSCYDVIRDGSWKGPEVYGVVHRIASAGTVKGAGSFCIMEAYRKCGHLRMDTHDDNKVMQACLEKLGFVRCGYVSVREDTAPRIAYEKM